MILEKLLYRPAECARLLSRGRTSVYEAIRSGELRSVKVNGSRLISRASLEEYAARLAGEHRQDAS